MSPHEGVDRREERRERRSVRKAMRGDADAFGELYDRYADRVYAFCRARVGGVQDAEDITETVFLKAFEAIDRYDERGLPFGAWIFRIARNAVVDFHRKSGRTPSMVPEEHAEPIEAPVDVEASVLERASGARVRAAVRELTDDQAAVIAARFYWGMGVRDTARALGTTEGAVKALQHRATRALKRLLEESSGTGDQAGDTG